MMTIIGYALVAVIAAALYIRGFAAGVKTEERQRRTHTIKIDATNVDEAVDAVRRELEQGQTSGTHCPDSTDLNKHP